MPDDLKFSEEGLKLHESLAKMMDEAFEAAEKAAAGAAVGFTLSGVIGAAAFVLALIKLMTDESDREMIAAMQGLQRQIDEIKGFLVQIDSRVDDLVDKFARNSNKEKLEYLLDDLAIFRRLDIEVLDRPGDADTAVRVTNEAGILCDKFLRGDFASWRWIDVVEKPYRNPATGETTVQTAPELDRFKNMPTLPIYAVGLLVWLGAREKAVAAGKKSRLVDDQARLERHRDATAVRPEFAKYSSDENRSTPTTIPEHIKSRIRAYPVASTTHAVNRVCTFYFDAGNMMTGRRKTGEPFDLIMPAGTVLCTLDPDTIGSPSMEIEMERAAGVDTLQELSELLGRLASGGSLKGQFIGVFSNTEVFAPTVLYVIDENGNLQWYRNESAAARGGSKVWSGPKKIADGWGGFAAVFNGGGHAIYAIQPEGTLLWYAHDGNADGTPALRGPKPVGSGWQGFKSVFSGGEYVVYGIQPDGRLLWYRHDGAHAGDPSSWAGATDVETGWHTFQRVFSGGDGIIYAIRSDGVLERRKHTGYLSGAPDWEPSEEIGTGWGGFRDVVAAADGVLYAFTSDGRVLWYRYGKRPPLPPGQETPNPYGEMVTGEPRWDVVTGGDAGGGEGVVIEEPRWDLVVTGGDVGGAEGMVIEEPLHVVDPEMEHWEGPVEIKRGFPGFRSAFVRMSMPYRGPN